MTKKQYILKLLTTLQQTRSLAPGLKLLVENDVLEGNLIDHLTEIFQKAVEESTHSQEQAKLEKGVLFLQTLKQREENQTQEEQKDIQILDHLLDSF